MPNNPPEKVTVLQANAPKEINGKYRQEITIVGKFGNQPLLITENFLPSGFTGETTLEVWNYKNKLYGKGTAQQPQQTPSQAAQPSIAPKADNNGQKEMRTVRSDALNAVMSATDVPLDMVSDYLVAGVQWIMIGRWELRPLSPDKLPGEADEDDIPF